MHAKRIHSAPAMLPITLLLLTAAAAPLPQAFGDGFTEGSTSPHFRARPAAAPAALGPAITFSEFTVNTPIANQYADRGVLFSGSSPFITTDSANPTSPVLSGSPRFRGAIEGRFVDPDDHTPTVVQAFQMDAGYFDEFGSTRLAWFDPDGVRLGQVTNSKFGIETFKVRGGNIASWRIEIFLTEPAGFAIDNLSFEPVSSSVVFREKIDSEKEGTWGFAGDEIPGFDHAALNAEGDVYESHPGYTAGTYYSADGKNSRAVARLNGVQSVHSVETFAHDSLDANTTPVVSFAEMPIPRELAEKMREKIQTRMSPRSRFAYIDTRNLEAIKRTLSPEVQKGKNNTFTCVGLVEWAAEQAGHRGGQGFINNSWEAIRAGGHVIPLLSPELLYRQMQMNQNVEDIKDWFMGFFDPVDFMITDPLGRRLGYTEATGRLQEIPDAFLTGDGKIEQFFIPNPLPGKYEVTLVGVSDTARIALANSEFATYQEAYLEAKQSHTSDLWMELQPGSPGDVNGDGTLSNIDVAALQALVPLFITGTFHPGDLNGDGALTSTDVTLLQQLIATQAAEDTPREVIEKTLAALNALPLTNARAKQARTAAARALTAGLSSALWSGSTPNTLRGMTVFTKLAQAATALPRIGKLEPTVSGDVQSYRDNLRSAALRISRAVADKALGKKIPARDRTAITTHFNRAAIAAAKGTLSTEITAYGKAWNVAVKALARLK